MGLTKDQQIYAAIDLLKHHGYKVYKDYSMLIGKWVAFWQEGMTPILHGKVIEVCGEDNTYFKVKCNEMALYYWIMQYSDCVKVISPASLVEKTKEGLQKALERYK